MFKKLWQNARRPKGINKNSKVGENIVFHTNDEANNDDDGETNKDEKENELIDFEIDENYLNNKESDVNIEEVEEDVDADIDNDIDDDVDNDIDTISNLGIKKIGARKSFLSSWSSSKDTEQLSEVGSVAGDILSISSQQLQSSANFVFKDNNLIALGKQITALEAACKADEDKEQHEFNEDALYQLNIQVKELQNICDRYRNQIESDKDKGINHIRALERELMIHLRSLEMKKKKKYFPFSQITIGQGGIYAAVNELWAENISGNFSLEIIPGQGQVSNPTVKINLAVTLHIQATGFKLFGEKGKNIPRLSFDKLKVRLSVNSEIIMRYDVIKTTWISDVFHFKVLSFKGPYGLTKSLVSTLLSLFKSQIKKGILDAFPPELGELLKGLPSNMNLSGEFDITGMSLKELSSNIYKSPTFVELSGYLPSKLKYFRWLQQSMEKSKPISSVWDMIYYRRLLIKHPKHAESIIHLWSKAINIYNEHVSKSMGNKDGNEVYQHCEFSDYLGTCDIIWKKKIAFSLKVVEVDGQVSLNSILRYGHQFLHRVAQQESSRIMKKTEENGSSSSSKKLFLNSIFRRKKSDDKTQKKSGDVNVQDSPKKANTDKKGVVREGQLLVMLDKIQSKYESAQDLLRTIVNNLDFAHSKIIGRLQSGPDGIIILNIHDFLLQVPLALHVALAKSMNLIYQPYIPTAMIMIAENNDDIRIEVYHEIPDTERKERNEPDRSTIISNAHRISVVETRSTTNRITISNDIDYYDDDYFDEDLADRFLVSTTTMSEQSIELLSETSTTFKSGSQIFSISLCNKDTARRPQRQHSDDEEGEDISKLESQNLNERTSSTGASEHNKTNPPQSRMSAHRRVSAIQTLGIRIKTAPTVKCLLQVQKIDTTCSLTNLLRYLSAHVEDVDSFQQYLLNTFGINAGDEISFLKFFIETFSKYFLHTGVDISINIDGKILSLENEIFIRLETLQDFLQDQDEETVTRQSEKVNRKFETESSAASSNKNQGPSKPSNLGPESCALSVYADIYTLDVYDDYLAIIAAYSAYSAFDNNN